MLCDLGGDITVLCLVFLVCKGGSGRVLCGPALFPLASTQYRTWLPDSLLLGGGRAALAITNLTSSKVFVGSAWLRGEESLLREPLPLLFRTSASSGSGNPQCVFIPEPPACQVWVPGGGPWVSSGSTDSVRGRKKPTRGPCHLSGPAQTPATEPLTLHIQHQGL